MLLQDVLKDGMWQKVFSAALKWFSVLCYDLSTLHFQLWLSSHYSFQIDSTRTHFNPIFRAAITTSSQNEVIAIWKTNGLAGQ